MSAIDEGQLKRLYANAVHDLMLVVPPTVIAGAEFSVSIRGEARHPSEKFRGELRGTIRGCGAEAAGKAGAIQASWHSPREWSLGSTLILTQPGSCEVECEVTIQLFWDQIDGSRPVFEINRTLTATTNVVTAAPDAYIRSVRSSKLDAAVRKCIWVQPLEASPIGKDLPGKLVEARICSKPPPCDLAFDLVIEHDDQSIPVGEVIFSAVTTSDLLQSSLLKETPGELPDEVTLVLRSSKLAAMQKSQMHEIWGGELRFDGVKVIEPLHHDPADHDRRYFGLIVEARPADIRASHIAGAGSLNRNRTASLRPPMPSPAFATPAIRISSDRPPPAPA